MTFKALQLALDAIRLLRIILPKIRRYDPKLADEIRRAANSTALNLAEGSRRRNNDRLHFYRVAAGSADEARTGLLVAEAWGYIEKHELAPPASRFDEVLRITWTITHR